MLPGGVLSIPDFPAPYLYPDSIVPDRDLDYEHGGVALNDPSLGLTYQKWTLRLLIDQFDVGSVLLSAENTPEMLLFALPGVTDVSLAFDQNMNPFVAFLQSGQARFWWFDTVSSSQIFSDLPVGTTAPKCCMDDKREEHTGTSDILMAYVRGDTLYYRQQRDRYEIEYALATPVVGQVLEIGMTTNNRVKIMVGTFE
jgi:hypothetical protein